MPSAFYVINNSFCTGNYFLLRWLRDILEANGYITTDMMMGADLVVFATCAFNQDREDQALGFVRKLYESPMVRSGATRLLVCGCLPAISPQGLKSVHQGLSVVGYKEIDRLTDLLGLKIPPKDVPIPNVRSLDDFLPARRRETVLPALEKLRKLDRERNEELHYTMSERIFSIRVVEGCLGKCTYCAIRRAHGKFASRPWDEVMGEFHRGVEQGFGRFLLYGDDVAAWGQEIGRNFTEILEAFRESNPPGLGIDLSCVNIHWLIRYWSRFRPIVEAGLIRTMSPSIQHASPRVLKLMGRPYDPREALETMRFILERGVLLKTEFIVGFPEEREEDFQELVAFIRELHSFERFIFTVFKFQPRENTPAAQMAPLPPEVVERRIQTISELFQSSREKRQGSRLLDELWGDRYRATVGLNQGEGRAKAQEAVLGPERTWGGEIRQMVGHMARGDRGRVLAEVRRWMGGWGRGN